MIWTIQEEIEAEWVNWRQARAVDGSGNTTGNGRDRNLGRPSYDPVSDHRSGREGGSEQLSTDRILIAIRLSRSSQIIFAQFIV